MSGFVAIRRRTKKHIKFWLKTIFTLGIYWLFWHRNDYVALTENTIVRRRGVIQRYERKVPLHRVQDVTIKQGLLARLLNYGHLSIETAGGSGAEIYIKDLGGPASFRDAIFNQIEAVGEPERVQASDV